MKNAERILKTIDIIMKALEDEENIERKQQLVNATHLLSNIHQTMMSDLIVRNNGN